MKIRQFEERDLESVLQLEMKYPPSSRDPISREDALRLHRQNPDACLIGEEDRVIAFIFCDIQDDTCIVSFMQVLPERLGEGIPDRLIEEVIEQNEVRSITFRK